METFMPHDYRPGQYWLLWRERAQRHDYEAHQLRGSKFISDPSCPICYPVNEETFPKESQLKNCFDIFWTWYSESFNAITYTIRTIQYFGNAIAEEHILAESENETGRVNDQIFKTIGSIRYFNIPELNELKVTIEVIHSIIQINKMRVENATNEEIIESLKIKQKERSEKEKLRKKFIRFWKWYQTVTTAQNFKAETVGYLDQLITLGEETNKNYDEIYTTLQLLVTSIEYEHLFTVNISL